MKLGEAFGKFNSLAGIRFGELFLPSININLSSPKFEMLHDIWEKDYYSICDQLKKHIETGVDGFIHMSNGRHI